MGSVGRAHGIRGEMGVNWDGEHMPRPGDQIYLQAAGQAPRPMQVAASRLHNGRLLLALQGVPDRTAAEKLTGQTILVPRAVLPQPAEGEAFIADLPGCEVFLPDGSPVGRLAHIEMPAGKLIWVIQPSEGNEILFPAEPEFIISLDTGARKIVIDPPPGLLDIYNNA